MHGLYDFWLKSWNLAEVSNFMCLSNEDMEQLRNIMGCRDISGIQLKPEVKVAGLLGQRSLESKWVTDETVSRDWLECLGCRRLLNHFIGSLHFLVLIENKVIKQRWLSRKMGLEISLLLYNLLILASEQKSFCFFEQLLSNFHYKKQLLIVFWATFERLFEKLRENFWKISSNLWKAIATSVYWVLLLLRLQEVPR